MMTKTLRHWNHLLIVAVIAVVLITPSAGQISAQDSSQTHIVQAGENLYRIALRYGYTVEYLAALNGITDVSTIYVGQSLSIPNETAVLTNTIQPSLQENPVTTSPAQPNQVIDLGILPSGPATAAEPAPAPVYHTVQPGETLAMVSSGQTSPTQMESLTRTPSTQTSSSPFLAQ